MKLKFKIFGLAGILAVVLFMLAFGGQNPVWIYCPEAPERLFCPPINVSLSPEVASGRPDIAIDMGEIYIVWEEEDPSGSGSSQILFSRAAFGGECPAGEEICFLRENIRPVSDPKVPSRKPAIAVGPQGDILVVWEGGEEEARAREIYLSRSIDGGESFSAPVNVSNTPEGDSQDPAIAVDPAVGNVYVIWSDNTTRANPEKDFEIFLTSAPIPPEGEPFAFTPPLNISNNTTRSLNPDIAVGARPAGEPPGPGDIYVVWEDEQRGRIAILFRQSAAFSSPMEISGDRIYRNQSPAIATGPEPGHIFVVWQAALTSLANPEILLTGAEDAGEDLRTPSFSVPFNLSNTAGPSREPAIAVDEQEERFIVWEESKGPYDLEPEIVFRSSLLPFILPLEVYDSDERSSLNPAIAVYAGEIYVVWEEEGFEQGGEQPKSEILFARARYETR